MAQGGKKGTSPTILIIEDNMGNAHLMQRVLEREGYTVLLSDNGEEGLEIALEKNPDLILLDLALPGINGQDVARRLKTPNGLPDTPIVVVSSLPTDTVVKVVTAYGCDGLIGKPIDTREFATRITEYLTSRIGSEMAPGEKPTILMIEDNPNNARLMRRVLERQHFTVHHAEDGSSGFAMAQELLPDLILLDLGLPDVDGQTVAAHLKQSETLANIPIVVVSAWPAETASEMVDAYGCEGYIAKPIDTREFASQVSTYLTPPSK
jgi:CheY-like chemotaxis protein